LASTCPRSRAKDCPASASNDKAIDEVGIRELFTPCKASPSAISHNKFIVYLRAAEIEQAGKDGNYVRAAHLLPKLEAAAEELGKKIDAALG
jgi:hypothetical protein